MATKVVHLGDQLEGVNTPRMRAVEAQMLMKYFSEFLENDRPLSHIFTDPFQVFIVHCIFTEREEILVGYLKSKIVCYLAQLPGRFFVSFTFSVSSVPEQLLLSWHGCAFVVLDVKSAVLSMVCTIIPKA